MPLRFSPGTTEAAGPVGDATKAGNGPAPATPSRRAAPNLPERALYGQNKVERRGRQRRNDFRDAATPVADRGRMLGEGGDLPANAAPMAVVPLEDVQVVEPLRRFFRG